MIIFCDNALLSDRSLGLDEMKGNVFFILGCPCAGKTTVAGLLARRNNMHLLSGDERRFDFYKHADKAKHRYMTMDASSFWDWSLDEMVDWERGVISEQTPMILEELDRLSEEHDSVLFEGMMDIDCLLSAAGRDHIVYLTADREICEKDFFGRGDHNGMLTAIMNTEGISDEEKKRRAEIRRAAAITAFYQDARSFGLQSFSRNDISSPLEMTYRIEQYFNMAQDLLRCTGDRQHHPGKG